jgi:hypothetical protein
MAAEPPTAPAVGPGTVTFKGGIPPFCELSNYHDFDNRLISADFLAARTAACRIANRRSFPGVGKMVLRPGMCRQSERAEARRQHNGLPWSGNLSGAGGDAMHNGRCRTLLPREIFAFDRRR